MNSRLRALPFTFWLLGAFVSFALVVAAQLGLERQVHTGLTASKALHRDGSATPAAALELEFLQFQGLLQGQMSDHIATDPAAIVKLNDSVFTRVQLLRQDPGWSAFAAERPTQPKWLRETVST